MFPFQRLNDLFIYIYQNNNVYPITVSKQFNISVRTIRTDIIIINETLTEYGGQILLKRNHGYSIEVFNENLFQDFIQLIQNTEAPTINLETPESRILYITCLLLTSNDYIKFEEMENTVFVSLNTLQNYLKIISKKLEKYRLEIINRSDYGVKVIGDEKLKRKCIVDTLQNANADDYISHFSNEEYFIFKDLNLDKTKQAMREIFILENVAVTDINLKNLVIHIMIMVLRIKHDNYIHFSPITDINSHYKPILDKIVLHLQEEYRIYVSEGERQYLYIHIVSNTNCDILGIDEDKVISFVASFLECIFQDYNFDLRHDSILIDDLIKHMKSILNTKYINPDKKNPLLNTIKSNFPLPYEVTLTCLNKVFYESNYVLDEDDAGYISLHIGAAIERRFNGKCKAKNIILVCDGSHATARILEARIENYFSNKINILGIQSCAEIELLAKEELKNIDFIITTTPINIKECPTVIVDFSLKITDIEAISKMLNDIQTIERENNVHFFDSNLFILNKIYDNKIELLSDLTQRLLDNHIIETNFMDSVLEREDLAKTNINDIFAFPHPMKFYAKETKVAVALLHKPLQWNEEETVQIIFLLATKIDEKESMESLYNLVVEIVNNPQLQKKILKVSNYDEFLDVLPNITQ